ncbi:PP2C family protein-serine/threonine phosphatase [Streptomyces sp. UNOC14_S4]|uniref:PP2C family protein-serine/threonine phosphatase n=1 Tax=Streptomyces sp. UNOC14_S4 TaxID=2872340 RepID=UPI001E527F37|nr:PP2C family protein-serine/threonine phosphatase [Streptomyces sp. UNOC14_S4]MCC3771034.1 serine/threonine-protein phosphatase [Streptomyces sp. UNOC14_S4]
MTRGTCDTARSGHPRLRRRSETGGWTLTAGLVAAVLAVLLVDIVTGPDFRIIHVSVIAAIIAAMYRTVRQTVVVTMVFCVSTGVVYAYGWREAGLLTSYAVVLGNVAIGAALVRLCALRQQHDHLLEQALSASETVQRFLIRPFPLHTDDATVDGFYHSSTQEALVGGDIYEALTTPHGTRVLIGDVLGKGLPALQAGMATLTSFRECAYDEPTLLGVADRLEQALLRHIQRAEQDAAESGESGGRRFVTALLLQLDPGGSALIVHCGHVPPFLFTTGGVTEVQLTAPGLPLGLDELAQDSRGEQKIPFAPGDRLALCTDGVTETRDAAGADYPLAARLRSWAALPSPRLIERLQQDLTDFARHEPHDDTAFLLVRRHSSERDDA